MKEKKLLYMLGSILFVSLLTAFAQQKKPAKKEKKQPPLTEEIVVEAPLPKDAPLAATCLIKKEKIENMAAKDISEILSYTSGTFVSTGSKNEFRLKIRGFSSQKIALLYDGIPVYEPYFNSFDLRTITAEEIESVKIVKGASSVLYGPNALGGVVNIISRRPNSPSFSLKTSYDSNKTTYLSSITAFDWKNLYFSGYASYEKSDGFRWPQNGQNVLRTNSNYERKNITGKIYYYPNPQSEILFEGSYYSSQYGLPAAIEYYRPRYWRFKEWTRAQFNLGGTFSLFRTGHLKLRSYYVRHYNVLDAYNSQDRQKLLWESTYDNDSYGVFLLGSLPHLSRSELKFSLNFRNDHVRTQDDVGKEWEEFKHQTFSAGIENHCSLSQHWKLIGGLSFDLLKKLSGQTKSTLNPIIGLKFFPQDYFDLHLSFSQKSRFPSMKSLYSSQGGNPGLRDERGTNYELGFTYNKNFLVKGAVFYNRIKDLIQVIRLPDGYKSNMNIGQAYIFGFELGIEKNITPFNFSANYTFLKGKDKEEKRPLDLLPQSQFNFSLEAALADSLRLSLWGIAISSSEVNIYDEQVEIPGYFILNILISKSLANFNIFLKVENLFNKYYVTEPGYPMKARTIVLGVKFSVG